eukprot:3356236-Pyramimonas_sp.AAC.1
MCHAAGRGRADADRAGGAAAGADPQPGAVPPGGRPPPHAGRRPRRGAELAARAPGGRLRGQGLHADKESASKTQKILAVCSAVQYRANLDALGGS